MPSRRHFRARPPTRSKPAIHTHALPGHYRIPKHGCQNRPGCLRTSVLLHQGPDWVRRLPLPGHPPTVHVARTLPTTLQRSRFLADPCRAPTQETRSGKLESHLSGLDARTFATHPAANVGALAPHDLRNRTRTSQNPSRKLLPPFLYRRPPTHAARHPGSTTQSPSLRPLRKF